MILLKYSAQHGFAMARKAWSLVSARQRTASCPALSVLSHRGSIGPHSCLHAALFCSGNFYSKCNTYVIPLLSSLEADSFKSYTGEFFSFTFHDFIITFFGRLCCEDLLHTIITPRGKIWLLLTQNQEYFIFQLFQKHPHYFPSSFFYPEVGF